MSETIRQQPCICLIVHKCIFIHICICIFIQTDITKPYFVVKLPSFVMMYLAPHIPVSCQCHPPRYATNAINPPMLPILPSPQTVICTGHLLKIIHNTISTPHNTHMCTIPTHRNTHAHNSGTLQHKHVHNSDTTHIYTFKCMHVPMQSHSPAPSAQRVIGKV